MTHLLPQLEQSLKDLRHVSDERDEVICEKEIFESKFKALNKRFCSFILIFIPANLFNTDCFTD